MKNKAILYIAGGGMSGVFGGGVALTLQEKHAYPYIKAVYAASAGAMDAAYFLTHQVELGASIYFNEARQGFIDLRQLWPGFKFLEKHGPIYPIHPDHYISVMHVDYLTDVFLNKKPLDIHKLVSQPIPFYVKVFNQHNHKVEYLNIKDFDPRKLLKATISMPPLTFSYELLHHNRMVDSCIAEVIGAKRLLARHQNDRVVVIINRRPQRTLIGWFLVKVEAQMGSKMYGQAYRTYPTAREKIFFGEVKLLRRQKNVLLVMPPRASSTKPQTTDLKKLRRTFDMGRRAGNRV